MSSAGEKTGVSILGSSGSIGRQTLDVCRQHADRIRVESLAVYSSLDHLVEAAHEFAPSVVAVGDASLADDPRLADLPASCDVVFGPEGVESLVHRDGTDAVVNGLMGAAGLRSSYSTLEAGKRLCLANKESLVVGGDLIMPLATTDMLLPVDSEHAAIFQCLVGEDRSRVHRIWLTASGGPFYGRTRGELTDITPEQALAHPTWNMGRKISIDSATLMNKGLEAIEARHLFDVAIDDVTVVVQRQSAVHSMVEFADGSVIAHLGATDMRIPIQYALSYPDRWETPAERVDFRDIADLTFSRPDPETFSCLALAFEAGRTGGTLPAVMNAANEVAVASFLDGELSFLGIPEVIGHVMREHSVQRVESLDQLEALDAEARARTSELIASTYGKQA